MNTFRPLLAAALAAAPLLGHAQLLQERNIPAGLAQQIAVGAVNACAQKGFNVAATVVDRAGVVRAVLRADNAGPHTLDGSRAKAYTSASMRNTTAAIGENVQKNPAAQFLPAIPGVLVLAGGVPIRAGNEVIGAVGVAGAPSGPTDGDCAATAIESVKDQLN